MNETLEFLKTQSEEIWKPYLSGQSQPQPPQPMNVRWLQALREDDVIQTDRDNESLVVVEDTLTTKRKARMVSVKVKRAHLKQPIYMKVCKEFEDHVEIVWSIHENYKQCEFNKWIVKREGIELSPEVLCTLTVEK